MRNEKKAVVNSVMTIYKSTLFTKSKQVLHHTYKV